MIALPLSALEAALQRAERDPKVFFGDDIDGILKRFHRNHPDLYSDDLKHRVTEIFSRFTQLADLARKPLVVLQTKSRAYTLFELLGIGDVSDVHLATCGEDDFIVKASRIPGADKLLVHEHFVLKELIEAAQGTTYKFYLPQPVETVRARDTILKQINVFTHEPGGFTLEQVHNRFPDGLDGRHLAWIFKRLLTILGFTHRQAWIHNAVLPTHVLIFPGTHGVQLLDWKFANQSQPLVSISAKFRDWYPPEVLGKQPTGPGTDLYLAAKCMIYLAGGNAASGVIPDTIPQEMRGYFRSCVLEAINMRPRDAWGFMDEFTEMLLDLYGKPKFQHLVMT